MASSLIGSSAACGTLPILVAQTNAQVARAALLHDRPTRLQIQTPEESAIWSPMAVVVACQAWKPQLIVCWHLSLILRHLMHLARHLVAVARSLTSSCSSFFHERLSESFACSGSGQDVHFHGTRAFVVPILFIHLFEPLGSPMSLAEPAGPVPALPKHFV